MHCITYIYSVNYIIHCDGRIYSLHAARRLRLLNRKHSPSHGTQKFDHTQFQVNNREKYIPLMIKDIIHCMLVFHSQEATCHRLEQNKLQQLSVYHWGMCVPSFTFLDEAMTSTTVLLWALCPRHMYLTVSKLSVLHKIKLSSWFSL